MQNEIRERLPQFYTFPKGIIYLEDGNPKEVINYIPVKSQHKDTKELHYVKVPQNHIVIDFDNMQMMLSIGKALCDGIYGYLGQQEDQEGGTLWTKE